MFVLVLLVRLCNWLSERGLKTDAELVDYNLPFWDYLPFMLATHGFTQALTMRAGCVSNQWVSHVFLLVVLCWTSKWHRRR